MSILNNHQLSEGRSRSNTNAPEYSARKYVLKSKDYFHAKTFVKFADEFLKTIIWKFDLFIFPVVYFLVS